MKEGEYVSDALVCESFKKGQINLIVAECGSGKSTAIYQTIPNKLGLSFGRILVLIDTTVGRDSFIQDGQAQTYKEENFERLKPTIMTYSMFGSKVKKMEIQLTDYDMIVCDEIHNMVRPVSIERGKLKKQFPDAFPWEINDMLSMTCFNYIAIETIRDFALKSDKWVFGLTATPANVYKINQFNSLINEVQFSKTLRAYDVISSFDYFDIEEILKQVIPDDRKRIFFFSTVKELKKYKKILIDAGRNAEALWSKNHSEEMDAHQLSTRAYLIEEHKLPDDVQDLLFNSAYETAITIKDKNIKECYIHTANQDTRVQARNRLRQDLEVVGYYNKDKAKNIQKVAQRNQEVAGGIWCIPDKYLGVKLDKENKENLIKELGFPKKWTSLKKWLIENGYKVEDKKSGEIRCSIITKI